MVIALFFWLCVFSIVYTYAGYPLLLAVLARLKHKKLLAPPADYAPTITLLIPAYNEQAVIAEKIQNCLDLDYPRDRMQILVVDDGSEDRTNEIARSFVGAGIEIVCNPPRRGKMAAMNLAIPLARGEIVLFSDADCFYYRNTLRQVVIPFADPGVGAVSGARKIPRTDGMLSESEGLYWKYESFIKAQETRLGSCTGFAGDLLAIRRAILELPPDKIINDDFYMGMQVLRRGYRVVYAPQANSIVRVSVSAQMEMERRARMVAGRYQALALARQVLPLRQPFAVWQVVSHKFLRPLVPLAMIGALLANILALIVPGDPNNAWVALGYPVNWIFLGLQLLFYALALVGNLLSRVRNSKLPFYLYLPTFLVNSNFAALVGLHRFLTRRQSTLWKRTPRREEADASQVTHE